jgi:hypothetical protein
MSDALREAVRRWTAEGTPEARAGLVVALQRAALGPWSIVGMGGESHAADVGWRGWCGTSPED